MNKRAKDVPPQSDPVRVVFVCMGNICRSPLAEGVFRHLVAKRGLTDRFAIDSAGISGYHEGDPPDARSAAVARQRGIELTGQSRPLKRRDLEHFDYVIVMDSENLAGVQRLAIGAAPSARIQYLREFDPDASGQLDVPDPYYGGASGFEHVQDMVERSCERLLDAIVKEHGW
ncbi:MAG: low molecular weight protein-tyrosine-phosphatase [Gemmatimonadota bacterium]